MDKLTGYEKWLGDNACFTYQEGCKKMYKLIKKLQKENEILKSELQQAKQKIIETFNEIELLSNS